MAHGGIMRERFAQLLDNPCGSGPGGHVKIENAPLGVIDREPDVEDSEGCGRNTEEVHRCDRVAVVAEKPHPTLDTLRDGKTQHAELTVNARSAPSRILSSQAQDQFA